MARLRSLLGTFSFMADSGSKSSQSTLNPSLHHERNQARFKRQPWRRRIRRVLLGILILPLFFYGIHGFRRLDTKEYKREDKWTRPSHCSYFVEDCETTASFIFDSVHSLQYLCTKLSLYCHCDCAAKYSTISYESMVWYTQQTNIFCLKRVS
jgi:hypothetical protein